MAGTRFDTIAKLFAQRKGAGRIAQDATPPAVDGEKTEFLFVQSFESGTFAPKTGSPDAFTLTLDHGLGQTVFFSDRPARVVGTTPTARFLGAIGFAPDNPPNAALVVETAPDQTDLAVVELFDPIYHEATHALTYEVGVLKKWEETLELGFAEAPTDLAGLAPTFGPAHLFIDDCPDGDVWCSLNGANAGDFGSLGHCYSWPQGNCYPCSPWYEKYSDARVYWSNQCNQTFATCQGQCFAEGVCSGGFLCPDQ